MPSYADRLGRTTQLDDVITASPVKAMSPTLDRGIGVDGHPKRGSFLPPVTLPLPALLPPGVPDTASARMDPVPALGQRTDTILRELGYAPERIAAMRSAKAV